MLNLHAPHKGTHYDTHQLHFYTNGPGVVSNKVCVIWADFFLQFLSATVYTEMLHTVSTLWTEGKTCICFNKTLLLSTWPARPLNFLDSNPIYYYKICSIIEWEINYHFHDTTNLLKVAYLCTWTTWMKLTLFL